MKHEMSGNGGGRALRTRAALIGAFNRLVLDRRKREIRVSDVITEADVGRSTFYDHYSSSEALHLDALRAPFAPLADAAAGQGDEAALAHILAHFWEYRQRARKSFGPRTERLLAQMIEERLRAAPLALPTPLAARQLAASTMAPILAWLAGEAPATPEQLAQVLCRSGEALRQSLRQ